MAGNGEKHISLQPIAVNIEGSRVPSVERQADRYLKSEPGSPKLSEDERLRLFSSFIEPTLQRELKHMGAANGDGSYSAELIGYIEIV